jgi:hypothetical protein
MNGAPMTKPLNSGQRLARGVVYIAHVEPEANAQIRNDVLYYGDASNPAYTTKYRDNLIELGWYESDGSWAFYT